MKHTYCGRIVSDMILLLLVLYLLYNLSTNLLKSETFAVVGLAVFMMTVRPHLGAYGLLAEKKGLCNLFLASGSKTCFQELRDTFLTCLGEERIDSNYVKQVLTLCIAIEMIAYGVYLFLIIL